MRYTRSDLDNALVGYEKKVNQELILAATTYLETKDELELNFLTYKMNLANLLLNMLDVIKKVNLVDFEYEIVIINFSLLIHDYYDKDIILELQQRSVDAMLLKRKIKKESREIAKYVSKRLGVKVIFNPLDLSYTELSKTAVNLLEELKKSK